MAHALLLLVVACIHEFAWQAFPAGTRGDVRDLTQWGLIATFCWVVYRRDARALPVCLAIVVMSSTTALCAGAWLIRPWPHVEGGSTCSRQLAVPMLLLSVCAASLATFAITKSRGK